MTQSTYIFQKWIDALSAGDRIVATADTGILRQTAPEAFARRGAWRFFNIVEISTPRDFCAVITRVRYRPTRKDNGAIPKSIAGRDAASP